MSSEEKTTKVVQTYDQPIEVGLSRSAKGQYYWKINVRAESPIAALGQVADIDNELRHRFTAEPETIPKDSRSNAVSPDPAHSRMDQTLKNIRSAEEQLTEIQGGEAP